MRGVKAAAAASSKWKLVLRAMFYKDIPAAAQAYLQRMKLNAPQTLQDKVVRMLLVEELKKAQVI